MKTSKKCLMIILLLFVLSLSNQLKIESIKEKPINNILFQPQAMGVYQKWNYQMDGVIYSSPTIADLNADGQFEILITTYYRKLYC